MARKNSRSDLITGGFALLVVVAFIGIVVYLQGLGPSVQGTRYMILFDDVGGMTSNTPVYVAGQRVGKVDSIRTIPRTEPDRARVEVEVGIIIDEQFANNVPMPVDTLARVQSGGFFGGPQIVLLLGSSPDLVAPGGRLPRMGEPPVTIDSLMLGLKGTVDSINEGLQNVAGILNDDTFYANIERSVASLSSTLTSLDSNLKELEPAFKSVGPAMENANELLAEVRKLVDENSRAITGMVSNLERASGRLDSLLADDGDGVPQLVAGLNHIAGNLDVLVDSLNDLVLDNQLNIAISLENVRETTESLRVFARRIESDPSLLVWGGKEEPAAAAPSRDLVPHVDELAIRNSGRRPRRESD
jgi:phospholipid/cholesterol/gamma-HCH transport system substrate-binding protein